MEKTNGGCGRCGRPKRICSSPADGTKPEFCITEQFEDTLNRAAEQYEIPDVREFAMAAARQEQACYERIPDRPGITKPLKPRIVEIMEFCERMGYRRIGFAFCGGLMTEAMAVNAIFESNGFEVVSAMCKVGGRDKTCLGLTDEDKIRPGGHESMCNPIGQAMVLNDAKTQFNIVLGLCVGHDSLFFKYSEAPVTVLAVKDRLLGHNPLAAIYAGNSYYKYLNKNK